MGDGAIWGLCRLTAGVCVSHWTQESSCGSNRCIQSRGTGLRQSQATTTTWLCCLCGMTSTTVTICCWTAPHWRPVAGIASSSTDSSSDSYCALLCGHCCLAWLVGSRTMVLTLRQAGAHSRGVVQFLKRFGIFYLCNGRHITELLCAQRCGTWCRVAGHVEVRLCAGRCKDKKFQNVSEIE